MYNWHADAPNEMAKTERTKGKFNKKKYEVDRD